MMLHVLTALVGLVLGLLVWSRSVRWIHAVWVAIRERRARAAGVSIPSIALLCVLHSGPWLLAGTIVLASVILLRPHGAEWPWFFGGMLLTPLVIALNVWRFLRRRQRQGRVVP